jgi:cytochrome c oxidase assembly protein subunit 15
MEALSSPARRRVGTWLALWAGMVLLLVVIGGATRLTESGLSITEWKPVTGVLPPLDRAAWEAEFQRYQQIPEYQQLKRGMSLAEFQTIYLWEFTHRLWARLVGLAFAVPFLVFLWRRELDGPLARRLGLILVLTGLQGAMGWYMVKSGLTVRTDVSQYRLAAHLALALLVYGMAVWTAAELLHFGGGPRAAPSPDALSPDGFARVALGLVLFVYLTIISGAFVAGLDAGRAWNTFPLMGGQVIPPGYGAIQPWYRNAFENVAAVQFHHRLLGLTAALFSIVVWRLGRRQPVSAAVRRALALLPALALLQASLGVTTLLLGVPVPVAALHQLCAVLVLTTALLVLEGATTTDGRR